MANRIGVIVESFRVGVMEGLTKAKAVGAGAVQIYIGDKDALQNVWTPAFRKDVRAKVADLGLTISAMVADMAGPGFEDSAENQWRVPETERRMDFMAEMGCPVMTTHIGVIPEDPNHARYAPMQAALDRLGTYGKKVGVTAAIETGPERPDVLLPFIESLHGGVGVNYDPANLTMVQGTDNVAGVKLLGKYIAHTHAKDGRMLKFGGGEKIYHFFSEGGIEDDRMSNYFEELPLGQGDANLPGWVAALHEIGYKGFFTIEREAGETPEKDIAEAVRYLQKLGI